MPPDNTIAELQARIAQLEKENAALRRDFGAVSKGAMVIVPDAVKPLFDAAQASVSEYFSHLMMEPTKGTIAIGEQRYVLVRASALSKDFLDTVLRLYADRGPAEAMSIGKNFLFDIAHVIGMNDARVFHEKMGFTEPMAKLSAGPVHFAFSGWAFVEILPESNPTPDENFYLFYNHPYSFEADSWMRSGTVAAAPVCIMNAGYSSGWCEESFGIPLTSVEVTCRGQGDAHCTFIMSPPDKMEAHLARFYEGSEAARPQKAYEIPTFFERKRVEEEMQRARTLAEESVKAKSDFLANMSHELRTPLGAIIGFADLLQKTALTAAQQDYLGAIHTSGANLLAIVNDVLDLSKMDAGRLRIDTIPFSVPELMHSLEVMFAARAAAKGLVFECNTDPAIGRHMLGDPMRLTQCLINLIGNAIKFTEQGSVQVHCRPEEESAGISHLHFTVADTGIGIAPEVAQLVFERFAQGDTDITRRYGGTGLGLAITKQLVALQGGSIEHETRAGGGSVFHMRLQYEAANNEAISESQMAGIAHSGGIGKRILIVDDYAMNQKLTEVVLKNNGFIPAIAENGAVALDMLRQASYDLILMDVQMPVMDGYAATAAIRNELLLRTPIIAMTAHALDGEKETCLKRGMNDYLAKPFKEEDLLIKMRHWLTRADAGVGPQHERRVTDLSFLRTETRNNKPFMQEMIAFFLAHNGDELKDLADAIAAEDFSAIGKKAHLLRNTTGLFGMDGAMGEQLLKIEQYARSSTGLAEIERLYNEALPIFAQAGRELSGLTPDTLA